MKDKGKGWQKAMEIAAIDKNLAVSCEITEPDLVWRNIRTAPFSILGIHYDERLGRFIRMPQDKAEAVSEGVAALNAHTAGGRVRFRTDSPFIGICARMENEPLMPHITLVGQSGFDLYRRTEAERKEVYVCSFMPRGGMKTGYSSSCTTDGTLADYTIDFPLYDGVKELFLALKRDAVLLEPKPYRHMLPVVYYGSSITQGGCASRPGNSYQAILSRRLDTDYINLGFSGGAKAEPAMAEYLAGLKMSVFVCDYDHNTPDVEYLKKTHLPLYRRIRDAQPELPIVLVSAPTIRKRPAEFELRRAVIRETFETALAEGDRHVFFIDGAELFEGEDWDSCTVDGTHPNDLGFYRMALRMEKELSLLLAEESGVQSHP